MNKLLGTTPSWGDVFKRFSSPVMVIGLIIILLNFLRGQFGWQIPVEWIEMVINFVVYGGTTTVMGLNDATNKAGA